VALINKVEAISGEELLVSVEGMGQSIVVNVRDGSSKVSEEIGKERVIDVARV
jgi:hypothetical protein